MSIQSRIDPFASFACKTADNCDQYLSITLTMLKLNNRLPPPYFPRGQWEFLEKLDGNGNGNDAKRKI